MSANIIEVPASDATSNYILTAEATGPQTAAISERATSKADGSVKNTDWKLTNVKVVNGVLNFTADGQNGTLNVYGDDVTIQTVGWMFGVGAQKLGPYEIADKDAQAIMTWMDLNFLHN